MAPLPAEQVASLTRRFQQQLATIGERSAPTLRNIWGRLDSYNEQDIRTFARQAGPIMAGAKTAAVRQAVGYYSLAANVRPVAVKVADVPVEADMREPFIAVWSSLKHGSTFDDAVAAGANRTDAVVRNLVTSSSRQTGDIVTARSRLNVVGWERIPDGGACAWCLDVAQAVYVSAEAADFGHDRCGCSAQPIYA